MKKIVFCLFVAFVITSCTLKEKMVINEDGSGTFSYGFDMSAMFKMGMKSNDSTKIKKAIDTTFSFKDIFDRAKDSIAKLPDVEKEKLKVLEAFKINMKVNEDQKQFEYNIAMSFPNIDSIQKMASPSEALETLAQTDKKRLGALSALPKQEKSAANTTSFIYDGKVFVKVISPSKESVKAKKKEKEKKEENIFGPKMDEMLKECKYSLEYSFPKKIKTVSIKNAVIATDRKSFTVEIPFEDFKDGNTDFGFKVFFEN